MIEGLTLATPELVSIPHKSQRFFTIDDLTHLPKPTWLIEGLLEANTLIMLAGPPASFKSFMCLDWLLCLAAGRPWNGNRVLPSKVLYLLGEGKSSLLKRVKAWMQYHQPTDEEVTRLNENFKVSFEVPQLAIKLSVDRLLSDLDREGYTPNIIAIDTFARSFVGLDENSQQDTGVWVESAERLRNLGNTVIAVHHTKKNTEMGLQYRGSTVLMGAMDTAMNMHTGSGKDTVILTVTKQKDHDEGDPQRFNRTIVKPDPLQEGSVVLTPAPFSIDERFTEEGQKEEVLISHLLTDDSFESDRARARELSRSLGIKDAAAQARIRRARNKE